MQFDFRANKLLTLASIKFQKLNVCYSLNGTIPVHREHANR